MGRVQEDRASAYATQGRYLFAGVVGITVLVALGVARLTGQRTTWQPIATLGVALALQGASLWICLDRYWGGTGVDDRCGRWSALPRCPAGTLAAAIVAATALACAIACCSWRRARRGPAPPD